MATVLTGQVVTAVAALCAVVVLGVFGVLDSDATAGLVAAILGGFGLGAKHQENASGGRESG